jgi:acyl-coenzyme A thioesterase PaaI-like protein
VIKAGRTLIFAESDVFAVLGEQRTLVAKLSATLAVVQTNP